MTEPAFLRDTRAAYDLVAANYAEALRDDLAARPLDRALLAAFAELVRARAAGPVADVGCGPGRITAHLRTLGVDAFGIDLSPGMVAQARRDHPGLRFEVGSMTALELADGALGGVVAWYSAIHLPPPERPGVLAELHRVLAPGGHLLLAFQAGDERRHVTEAYGHTFPAVDAYWLPPARIAAELAAAGFEVRARLEREPEGDLEPRPQAFVLARKPDGAAVR